MLMIKYYLYKIIYKNKMVICMHFAVCSIILLLFIYKMYAHYTVQDQLLNNILVTLAQQNERIYKITQDESKLQTLHQEWDHLQSDWLQEIQTNRIFNDIEQMARKSHITLNNMTMDETMTLSLYAPYVHLLKLIQLLNAHSYILLKNLQFKKEDQMIFATIHFDILLRSKDV